MGLANYFISLSISELQNHYFCIIKFWASVCWHYPSPQNKQVLSQNISQLALIYAQKGDGE